MERPRLGSRVEALDIDVPDLDPARLGQFDTVLFLGVLYHLPDPRAGLLKAAAMSSDHLVIETETALDILSWPVLRYFPGDSLAGDSTNFYAPNKAWLRAILREAGFGRFETATLRRRPSALRGRIVMHAWRT